MVKPKAYVIGVGMTKFSKPGSVGWDYPDMQATVGYLFGGTCRGQRVLYECGLTGILIFNVNNACASGSSGVFLCKQIIESGNADVVLASDSREWPLEVWKI
ncbi:unnamed protein product [Caenorhabditis auriculariae]|uniref:Thiolase N-terminal domain-containing protein n=1 Tax=Caenorhabditis auriculariae TaxID=2777116 RepID=A0A8S1HPF4_9PELO|nr:unnamed protein product [Caenorhabditis auriculariae]